MQEVLEVIRGCDLIKCFVYCCTPCIQSNRQCARFLSQLNIKFSNSTWGNSELQISAQLLWCSGVGQGTLLQVLLVKEVKWWEPRTGPYPVAAPRLWNTLQVTSTQPQAFKAFKNWTLNESTLIELMLLFHLLHVYLQLNNCWKWLTTLDLWLFWCK